MKLLLALSLFVVVVSVYGGPAVDEKPGIVHTTQRRWLADDLKAFHQEMRKIHKNYIPFYPDAPILTVISVGTPPVKFWVSMESGSEATFLLAKDYPGRLVNQSFFDPAQSSTAQHIGPYGAFSGDLEVFGEAFKDVIGLFGFDASEKTTQRFGVVNNVDDPYWILPEMPDGVLGLSWDPTDAAAPNENSSAIVNFFRNARSSNASDFGRQWAGVTQFGECLEEYCAQATVENTYPLTWLPESRSLAFWVDSFAYNEQQFAAGFAKVDTGVPNILLPYDAFVAVYLDVNANYDFDHGIYTVDCSFKNVLTDWTFTIGGKNYTVPATAYVTDLLLSDGQCALSMYMSDAETTDYVFGYVFHNLWCIKMDIDNQAISIMDVMV